MAQTRGNDHVLREVRRVWCYEMRLRGFAIRTISAIAEHPTREDIAREPGRYPPDLIPGLGHPLSRSTVHDLITSEIALRKNPKAAELREIEVERLDAYLIALEPAIVKGDATSIGTAVRISESRRKLLGIDAPAQIEHTVHNLDPADTELAEIIREAQARNAAREAAARSARS